MKNLELMGVQEMDASEMSNVDGGVLGAILAAIAIAAWGIGNVVKDVIINGEPLDVTKW